MVSLRTGLLLIFGRGVVPSILKMLHLLVQLVSFGAGLPLRDADLLICAVVDCNSHGGGSWGKSAVWILSSNGAGVAVTGGY